MADRYQLSCNNCTLSAISKCPETENIDQRDEKFYAEPEEFRVGRPPKIFTLSEFNFTLAPFPVLEECSCENGKEALQKGFIGKRFITDNSQDITEVKIEEYKLPVSMKYVEFVDKFRNRPEANTRKTRHESYLKQGSPKIHD